MNSFKCTFLSVLMYLNFVLVFTYICPMSETIDITDGFSINNDVIIHQNVTFTKKNFFTSQSRIYGCICNIKSCIPKCCPDGHIFIEGTCTMFEGFTSVEFDVYDDKNQMKIHRNAVHHLGNSICEGDKSVEYLENIRIYKTGHVVMKDLGIFESNEYCIESMDDPESVIMLWCSKYDTIENIEIEIIWYEYPGIFSGILVICSILAIAFSSPQRLYFKMSICYLLSSLLAHIFLLTIQMSPNISSELCSALALICYFSFMALYFWRNAICLDIYFTFSKDQLVDGNQNKKHFLYYSIYAWSCPVLFLAIAAACTYIEISPDVALHTGIGRGQCWFRSNGWTIGIYYYTPIVILSVVNTVLFGITIYKIVKIRNSILSLNTSTMSHHSNMKKIFWYPNLLLVMGVYGVIVFILEIISWSIGWNSYVSVVLSYVAVILDHLYGSLVIVCNVLASYIVGILRRNSLTCLKDLNSTKRQEQNNLSEDSYI